MSLIEYQAEPLETKEAMLKRYAAGKARLWGTVPKPKPIQVIAAEEPPAVPERKLLVSDPVVIDDDEYAAMLVGIYKPLTRWERIVKTVAHHYQVRPVEIRGGARTAKLVRPRHVAMFLAVKGLGFSYPKTGALLGGRDHTTVLHGVRKIQTEIDANPLFAQQIADLLRSCGLPPL